MKFETYMLRGLFAACVTLCVLVLGAMLTTPPPGAALGMRGQITAELLSAPGSCALPADGVLCPRSDG